MFMLPSLAIADGFNFELHQAKLSEVMQLFLKSIFKQPYSMSPELQNDNTPISLSVKNRSKKEAAEIFEHFLNQHNITYKNVAGVYFFEKNKNKQALPPVTSIQTPTPTPTPTPINETLEEKTPINETDYKQSDDNEPLFLTQTPQKKELDYDITMYKPHHLPPAELQNLLKFLGIDSQIANEMLLFKNHELDLDKVNELLAKFDGYNNDLLIRCYIFEFQKSKRNQSAVQAALSILQNTVSIAIPTFGLQAPALSLAIPNIDLVIQNIASSDDFKVLSEPYIRASHNKKSMINVGASVPTLSQITQTNQGQPIQNITYRNSGLSVDVLPRIFTDIIELDIHTEISNFIQTTNGVNQSPTLIQRKLETTVKVKDNETIFMGGLTQNRTDNTKNSFFGVPIGNSETKEQTDLLIVLNIKKL